MKNERSYFINHTYDSTEILKEYFGFNLELEYRRLGSSKATGSHIFETLANSQRFFALKLKADVLALNQTYFWKKSTELKQIIQSI